jgi:hypothetical protein
MEYLNLLLKEFIPAEEEEYQSPKIAGTWIAKGNSYANRWIFRRSSMVEKYYEGELYKMYHYEIRPPSDPSKSDLKELILANVNNPGTKIEFQVSVLTGEQLILVYYNGIDESKRVFDRY